MKKLINFRPITLTGVCFAVGIFIADFFPTLKAWTFIIPVFAVILVAALYAAFYKKKKVLKISLAALYFSAVCLLGAGSLLLKANIAESRALSAGTYLVTGEITEYYSDDGNTNIVLGNCVSGGKKTGNIYVSGFSGEGKLYETLEISLKVSPVKSDGRISGLLKRGVSSYSDTVYYSAVKGESGALSGKFLRIAEETFYGGMNEREARVATAMFTGATYGMRSEKEWYRAAGLSHIFAVSGLHVGMLFGALSFVLSLLRLKRIPKAAIIGAAVVFYAYLCGLSASCVRAAVMCTVFAFTSALGEKPDRINSISVAFIIVLAIDPADMFSVGFILSFTVSLSLIILSSPIKRAFKFLPDKLSSLFSGLIAAELASAPICIIKFGSFPLSALVMNLLFLPILSFVYYFLWITFVFGAVFPAVREVAAYIPSLFLFGTDEIAKFVSAFSPAITVFPPALCSLYYPAAVFGSDIVNTGKKTKAVCFAVMLLSLVVCAFVSFI